MPITRLAGALARAMKASDMKVGMRVAITAVTNEADDWIAKSIQLGPDPAAK